jgi:hypothetical protein
MPPVYTLLADLDGDTVCETDLSADVRSATWTRGRDNEFGTVQPGELTITLRSGDGKYHIGHANQIAGWQVGRRIQMTVAVNGMTYGVMFGRIGGIRPFQRGPGTKDGCEVVVHDNLAVLSAKTISTEVETGIPYSHPTQTSAVGMICDAAGVGNRKLYSTADILPYVWFESQGALDALSEVQAAERGLFYINGWDQLVYQDRYYRFRELRATNPTLSISAVSNISNAAVEDDIYTEVRVQSFPRTAQPLGVIWSTTDPIILDPLQTIPVVANFNIPAINVLAPVAGTDYYAVNPATGADATGDIRIVVTNYAASAKIVLTNTASSARGVGLLQLRGQVIADINPGQTTAVVSSPLVYGLGYWQLSASTPDANGYHLAVTSNSKTTKLAGNGDTAYTPRTMDLSPRLLSSLSDAESLARYILNRQGIQNPRVELTIQISDDTTLATFLAMDLSDRLTLNLSDLGISGDYWIEHIKQDFHSFNAPHETTLQLTSAGSSSYWQLASDPNDTTWVWRLSVAAGGHQNATLAY